MKKVNLQSIVERAVREGVKSIFLFPGFPPLGNKREIVKLGDVSFGNEEIRNILNITMTPLQHERFEAEKELDYSYEIDGVGRFRVNAFFKLGNPGIVMRPIPNEVPAFDLLGLPEVLKELIKQRAGLILITGPTGSGKSTTLASLIDFINREKACHIVTIEDPIEFVFEHKKSIISQREIGKDTKSFHEALKRVLREDPDIIMVGEIRDSDSMKVVIEMAETGHLIFSTLHTINVAQTLNRIMDFFDDYEKSQVRAQMSQVLKGIVSQRLIQRLDGKGFVCACEVLLVNQSVKNLIKEDKLQQIYTAMQVSKKEGMITMDEALLKIGEKGLADIPELLMHSTKNKDFIGKLVEQSQMIQEPSKKTEGVPAGKPAVRRDLFSGKRGLDVEKDMMLYEADFSFNNLSFFDASGLLFNTPMGLLFRDTGRSSGEFHFIADYAILNGRKEPFSLKSIFSLSYKILEIKVEKRYYHFKLRVVIDNKENIEIPLTPVELVRDSDSHTLTIPVPGVHIGKTVKYYMLIFDTDIKEIVFNAICFL